MNLLSSLITFDSFKEMCHLENVLYYSSTEIVSLQIGPQHNIKDFCDYDTVKQFSMYYKFYKCNFL